VRYGNARPGLVSSEVGGNYGLGGKVGVTRIHASTN